MSIGSAIRVIVLTKDHRSLVLGAPDVEYKLNELPSKDVTLVWSGEITPENIAELPERIALLTTSCFGKLALASLLSAALGEPKKKPFGSAYPTDRTIIEDSRASSTDIELPRSRQKTDASVKKDIQRTYNRVKQRGPQRRSLPQHRHKNGHR
jgi:hypothetical protein